MGYDGLPTDGRWVCGLHHRIGDEWGVTGQQPNRGLRYDGRSCVLIKAQSDPEAMDSSERLLVHPSGKNLFISLQRRNKKRSHLEEEHVAH